MLLLLLLVLLLLLLVLLLLVLRRSLLLVAANVGRSRSVVAAAHLVHVVRRVLEELMRRRVDRLDVVEVAAGNEGGVVRRAGHVVRRLALNLALDALAVGSVADHGCEERWSVSTSFE